MRGRGRREKIYPEARIIKKRPGVFNDKHLRSCMNQQKERLLLEDQVSARGRNRSRGTVKRRGLEDRPKGIGIVEGFQRRIDQVSAR
jgi:hypothetical protein